MAVDLTLRGGFEPPLHYWLAALCYWAYAEEGQFPAALANVPGPCTFGRTSWFWSDPVLGVPSSVMKCWWFDYGEWLVLALDGVEQWTDIALSLGAFPQFFHSGTPGFVHEVWYNMSLRHRLELTPVIQSITETRGVKVLLTGHSLGGALCQLLAHRLKHDTGLDIKGIVTFGSPMPGNINFQHLTPWPVIRIENTGDLVPFLPPNHRPSIFKPFRRAINDLALAYSPSEIGFTLDRNGEVINGRDYYFDGLTSAHTLVMGYADRTDAHRMGVYLERIRGRMDFDITTFGGRERRLPDLYRVDEVMAAEWSTRGLPWRWASSYPIPYVPAVSNWTAVAATMQYQPSPCPGIPGHRCCSQE